MDTTRAALAPLIEARGWRALLHNLLGLPLGTAYFTWYVTGLATGVGLAITLVGIPILTLVLASVRPLMAGERALANALLDTDLPPTPLAPDGEGWLGRLKAYWTDGETWRGLAYLFVRFPVGLATFCVAVTAYGTALLAIAAPVVAPLSPFDLGFWHPDSVLDGLALVPFGVIALVGSGWISEGLAAISRALIGWVSPEPSRWLFGAP